MFSLKKLERLLFGKMSVIEDMECVFMEKVPDHMKSCIIQDGGNDFESIIKSETHLP